MYTAIQNHALKRTFNHPHHSNPPSKNPVQHNFAVMQATRSQNNTLSTHTHCTLTTYVLLSQTVRCPAGAIGRTSNGEDAERKRQRTVSAMRTGMGGWSMRAERLTGRTMHNGVERNLFIRDTKKRSSRPQNLHCHICGLMKEKPPK